jgi:RNA polymerase sigma factor (sigma-70 family)
LNHPEWHSALWVRANVMDEKHIYYELLVLRTKRGDLSAVEEIVRHWERQLFYYVRGLVGREQDAWDILQETWLRVVRDIGSLRDPKALSAWLYTVARNRALTHMRDSSREELMAECGEDLAQAPENGDLSFEDAEAIHSALSKLTLPHREVLTLYFMEDLSIDEIASVLRCPTGTIKSRLHFAKRALKAILQQEGIR